MKLILLWGGQSAKVDDEDYEWLNAFKWYGRPNKKGGHVVQRIEKDKDSNGRWKYRTVYMSREILQAPKGMLVDHINQETLDNQKSNLRLCSHSQNVKNRRIHKNNTSGFKGVYWHKANKKWFASVGIGVGGRVKYLGYADTKEECARLRDQHAQKLYGEFASLNFPD